MGGSARSGETRLSTPGGQGWNDIWLLGTERDPFLTIIPDIRLPPNQFWPLHWHDCWIAVVILDGLCLIGDWWMEPGDVLISAAELEYGPVVAGPDGCQLFEVGAQAHLFAGGYAPEYADHVTLQGSGPFTFVPRSERNRRNEGKQALPVDGVDGSPRATSRRATGGISVTRRIRTGRRWHCAVFAPGATIAPHTYGDWHWALVTRGSARLGPHELTMDDVLVVEPGAPGAPDRRGPRRHRMVRSRSSLPGRAPELRRATSITSRRARIDRQGRRGVRGRDRRRHLDRSLDRRGHRAAARGRGRQGGGRRPRRGRGRTAPSSSLSTRAARRSRQHYEAADEDSARRLMERAVSEFGGIDGVHFNAIDTVG